MQILCRPPTEDSDPQPFEWQPGERVVLSDPDLCSPMTLLARPFSLAGREDAEDGTRLSIIHRVVGVGTDYLAKLAPGDVVSVLGPLGNRFVLPKEHQTALLIGGGVGIPPMLYLARRLAGRDAIAFCGATTRDLLPLTLTASPATDARPTRCIAEFDRCGIPAVITTDDASCGMGGFVTQALERVLEGASGNARFAPVIYTCGPEPMMRRVADIAARRGIPCQVAVERAMACGMGTCQSCVIKAKTPDGWRYRLSCTDGPVFDAADLIW